MRIRNSAKYVAQFREAFGTDQPTVLQMQQAIASFERTLLSKGTAPFDRHAAGDTAAMSAAAKRGLALFLSEKGECFHCHSIGNKLFTNFTFENNGLYATYPDVGRFNVTGIERDKGKFKVPSLRNITLTAPYMHDGSLKTLEEVVAHYASGGKNNPYKSAFLFNISLNAAEQADIVAFLKALTDE
jgi:cytochrome c peroxidase